MFREYKDKLKREKEDKLRKAYSVNAYGAVDAPLTPTDDKILRNITSSQRRADELLQAGRSKIKDTPLNEQQLGQLFRTPIYQSGKGRKRKTPPRLFD